jgi:hypothetical protein
MRIERRAAAAIAALFSALTLIAACTGCSRLRGYTLVSDEYGFSVTFPEKPVHISDKNSQGQAKELWTVYPDGVNAFYSAQATSYRQQLPTGYWVPGQGVGEMAGIQLMETRRFKLRSAQSGREAVAIATTARAPSGGNISSIYVIDGTKLISVTARTDNERDRNAFLQSLKLLR